MTSLITLSTAALVFVFSAPASPGTHGSRTSIGSHRSSSSYHSSPKSHAGHHSRSESRPSYPTTSRSHSSGSSKAYSSGGTRYRTGETYKTTGKPKVERSMTAKKKFLKSLGYKRVPPGYEVDHVIPLSEGGPDTPSNMQLIPKSVHKQKTAAERKRDRSHR
jgi:hypothetical protein